MPARQSPVWRSQADGTVGGVAAADPTATLGTLFFGIAGADHPDQVPIGQAADKDPEWRATARYSRDELEILIADPRLPLDRRALYAIDGIAGLRLGEAAGLRFRHYDPSLQPLGLLIARSYDKGRTKT